MIGFRIRLKAVGLLTVGWGVPEVVGADVVHARKLVGDRFELYIPGSSVKGALRTSASRVAEAYGFTSCGEVKPEMIEQAHKSMGGPCDVCRLFGYPGTRPEGHAKLYVSDFRAVGELTTEIVTRVSLSDTTLTAKEDMLYTMENLPPGVEFEGFVRLEEGARELLPLLLLAMAELRTGRFGRRSVVDLKVEDEGRLDGLIGDEWKPLLQRMRRWLWERVVQP
ncbi:RAMP superfamily CRISPR-associated protein [Infirmifilum sp. NZ]|uniref:RAMP superfamily CRISPR-associated protein n=1 Tax=Infirmifilum sp. NZ TaxID=2926850 RepID=UPI0027A419CE|nr:RAMP superfamily CRISPR-associated protein [Infirmifilum sp. NZ]UNQ73756.1 RAMP superfamily CRISPR-associated protein [Infirmifilum sp. NZ]